jgi:quinohemoprotein amine dehydrogenase
LPQELPLSRRVRQLAAVFFILSVLSASARAESVADPALTAEGKSIVAARCVGCHTRDDAGNLSRISEQRKTPEGWHMTLSRMQHNHGLVLSDREKDAVVKFLADTQGLAPSEAAPYRYVLERRDNTIERYNAIDRPDPEGVALRCTVCHSYARVALQRRTEAEWLLLLHFHLGQYPAIEFQPQSRTSPWWEEVAPKMPGVLARLFPFSDSAWSTWQARPKADLSGSWRIVGHLPGVGFYSGVRVITRVGADQYTTTSSWEFADGHKESSEGTAIVYTGYEWRGRAAVRREDIREIYAVSDDGDELGGRWFDSRHSEIGADLLAVRVRSGESRVLAAEPCSIKAGTQKRITIYGTNLAGAPDFGPQLRVSVVEHSSDRVVVDVSADRAAAPGVRAVKMGLADSRATLAVYRAVDHVRVAPDYAFTRLGEGGGKVPFVGAQFEAVAYAADSSAKGGEIPLGAVPAEWKLEPHTETAKEWDDQLYAGRITKSGQFIPAQGGINPARTKGTLNNTGDLTVKATVQVDGRTFEGASHLIVSTGMLFFNVPIR